MGSWFTEILDDLAIAKNVEEEKSSGVIVCQVPPYWKFGKEDAFIPQFVGLGLYHHFRPELPLTDKFKLVSPLMLDGFLNSNLDEQLLQFNLENIDIEGFYKVEIMEDFNIQGPLNSLIDLDSALLNFCEASCPLVKFEKLSPSPDNYDHLLCLMYRMMVPPLAERTKRPKSSNENNSCFSFICLVFRRLEQQENQGLQEPGPYQGPWNMSCEAISATELHNCGIGFCGFEGGISSIKFNDQHVLRLPKMYLDVNSEVIIRNLLAYEQLTEFGYELVLSSYIELMKSLIDTPKDAELLVREGVIITELSAEVVHQLFNGLKNRSIRPVYNEQLFSEVLKLLVKYNENRKIKRAVTKFSICSGKIVIVLAVLIFLVPTAVQLYCSAFGCAPASEFGPEVGKCRKKNKTMVEEEWM
ncbi:hypothetical protein P8452_62185 [Trifolium repens]|nr:hypothetical protein P8452_62185 [Trifolium repens]